MRFESGYARLESTFTHLCTWGSCSRPIVESEKTARRTRESTENKAITANLPGELSRGAFAVVGHPTLAEIYEYNYHAVDNDYSTLTSILDCRCTIFDALFQHT
jgi:hypothetical protein